MVVIEQMVWIHGRSDVFFLLPATGLGNDTDSLHIAPIDLVPWYCRINGSEVGPLNPSEWSRLVSERLITGESFVWKEGMSGWRPLAEITGGAVPTTSPDHRLERCHECGWLLPSDDLMHLGTGRVCAACKPAYLQRVQEGAPPASHDPSVGTFAAGRHVVIRHGAVPPARCILCNAPGTWRKRQSYSWHPNWLILSLLCTPLALVIAAMIFSRTLQLELFLCAEHARQRTRRLILAGVWVVTGVLLLLGGIFGARFGLPLPAFICIVTSGIISILMGPLFAQRASGVLIARRIDEHGAVLRGAHASFLASLPPWTGGPV